MSILYKSRPGVKWVVERECIVVISEGIKDHIILNYPEAALWDYLSRELEYGRICGDMALLLGKKRSEAERWISACLKNWKRMGLLEKA